MTKGPLIIILAGIGFAALLWLAPVKPQDASESSVTKQEAAAPEENGQASVDQQIEVALQQLRNGEGPPMAAINKLRTIVEEHPDNVKASFTLGMLSSRTGQYNKALKRFENVLRIDPDNVDAMRYMGRAQLNLQDTAAARKSFEKAYKAADKKTKASIKEELAELSINKKEQ